MSLINDALKRANQTHRNHPPAPAPAAGPQFRPVERGQRHRTGPGMFWPVALVAAVALVAFLVWLAWPKHGAIQQTAGAVAGKMVVPAKVSPPVLSQRNPPVQNPKATAATPSGSTPRTTVAATKPGAATTTPNTTPPAHVQVSAPRSSLPAPSGTASRGTVATTKSSAVTTSRNTTPPPAVPAPAPTPPAAAPPATIQQPATPVAPVVASQPLPKPVLPKLQGIFYRPDRPEAIIDGKTVLVGDRVGEFRVLAISRDDVTLAGAGQTNVLSLASY